MIKAEIVADSVGTHGCRITSFVLTYPRFIHAEVMTHRAFSRNAASSRAIPVQKMIDDVNQHPARPIHWGRNQKGMQAHDALDTATAEQAIRLWDNAAREAVATVKKLLDLGVHKQVANRILEPFTHMVTLVTATDLHNFFALRAHADAQPEFHALAFSMLEAYHVNSTPQLVKPGEWHVPFAGELTGGLRIDQRLKIATARAARVSYRTFGGEIDPEADFALHDRLKDSGHWSPFEHSAQCLDSPRRSGNFTGWDQYRKTFPQENRTEVDLGALLASRRRFEWEHFQSALPPA